MEVYEASIGETGKPYRLVRFTTGWSEGVVTWNNKPRIASGYYDVEISDSSAGWWEFDITTLIQEWEDGTYDNYGMGILSPAGCTLSAVYSSDNNSAAQRPKLTVNYTVNSAVEEATWGQIKADL